MRIYHDISDVLEYARGNSTLSGIQRTTLSLLNYLVNRHGADVVRVIAIHPHTRKVRTYDASYFAGQFSFDQAHFCNAFGLKMYDNYGLAARIGHEISEWMNWNPYRNSAMGKNNFLGNGSSRPRLSGNPVEFVTGDVVFVGGATWGVQDFLGFLAERRRIDGIRVIHFIHDLIPLLIPEHVIDGVPEKFAAWLKHLAANVDGFLANSNATKEDLDRWLADHGTLVDTRVVRLAHQFGMDARTLPGASGHSVVVGEIGARVRDAARAPYVLCVGTLEPRKNIGMLINVWRSIQAKLRERTPRLVFAGNPGWKREDFDRLIAATGSLSGYISVLERPTDGELAFLYRASLFSVFMSEKEGWGLPIGESLWFGRPVVCSNSSAMPEVGGRLADYADPSSPELIETAVMRLITDVAYRETRAGEIAVAGLRSWADVADDLWDALLVGSASTSGRTDVNVTASVAHPAAIGDNA